jgi:hypothetical protein
VQEKGSTRNNSARFGEDQDHHVQRKVEKDGSINISTLQLKTSLEKDYTKTASDYFNDSPSGGGSKMPAMVQAKMEHGFGLE